MRRLVLNYYVSVDGKSVDADNGMRDVMGAIDDPEQDSDYVAQLWQAGAFLMGWNSYAAMKGFWPTSEHPSAPAMNAIPKIVFTRSQRASDDTWPAQIMAGDLAKNVATLKAGDGKDLVANAGDEFLQSLIDLDVVDEYRLWLLPAAAGTGTPLFPRLDGPRRLRLISCKAYPSGIVALVYRLAD